MRRTTFLAARAAALLAPAASAAAAPTPARVRVDVNVQKFVVQKNGIRALGYASAELGGKGTRRLVRLAVKGGGSCRVLDLKIEELKLFLLGLNLDASTINLHITGNQDRTLGKLFCRLAKGLNLGSSSKAAVAAARSLNRRLGRRPMRAIGFSARLRPQTATAEASQSPAPSCRVLDLVLGPLNLDLLGLQVDLYGAKPTDPVQVVITADPNGGVLGSVFCKLAYGQPAQ